MMDVSKDTIHMIRNRILHDAEELIRLGRCDKRLEIIQTCEDDASDIYVRNKIKTCESVGIRCQVIKKDFDITDMIELIDLMKEDDDIAGIIVQLPLSDKLRPYERIILNHIPWWKDVDGLSTDSVGRLWTNRSCLKPATASAVCKLIDYNIPDGLSCRKVSVINRSPLIGKPLTKMLLDRNATVEVLHSKSHPADIRRAFMYSDIVITGVGNTNLMDYFDESYDTTWIDCGINRDSEDHVCGDAGSLKSDLISPVPSGIGVLTTACICYNVLHAQNYKKHLDMEY